MEAELQRAFGPGPIEWLLALREELLWKLQCLRNRRRPSDAPLALPAAYALRAGSVQAGDCQLCVVVTTYGRPDACARLLGALEQALERSAKVRAFVLVLRDTSAHDYQPVHALLEARFAGRCALFESEARLGKAGFWYTYQHAFDRIAELGAPLAIFLQDDVAFGPGLVSDALALWSCIDDADKAVLYLLSSRDDERTGRWIIAPRGPAVGGVRRTQWFDLQAFLAGPKFFQTLEGEVFASSAGRWVVDPTLSSGVGEQFTLRLFGRANTYQVVRTRVFHGAAASLLNPEARKRRALDNRPVGAAPNTCL